MLEDVLTIWKAAEVSAEEVYSRIFAIGSGRIQKNEEESRNRKANPLGYYKNRNMKKGHYRIFFEDTFSETLHELQEADFAIVNGITYFGRKNLQAAASQMHALIFDLDGVTNRTLNNFLSGAIVADAYPVPNYIALSGHGVHLYYLFETPVPLYPNIKIQLKALKYALTDKMWNPLTSKDDKKQFQGINQGFRPIGGKTKIDGVRVRAFEVNKELFTLEKLGEYVLEEFRVDSSQLYKESKLTLEDAKKLYPEWYHKRIEENDRSRGRWTTKRDLYDWWKRQIKAGASFHHRYFNIMCLAIYAVKAGIEEEELRRDAFDLIPFMNGIAPDAPFTVEDVESALECFDERYVTFPIDDITRLSGIPIQKNKRNGRKQKDHLRRIRLLRDLDHPDDSWMNKDGRPKKDKEVEAWQMQHPEGRKADCIRETGLDRKTVSKYWKEKELP